MGRNPRANVKNKVRIRIEGQNLFLLPSATAGGKKKNQKTRYEILKFF